ncbi:UNVERIFIED_CONTAM: hypothetical protein PYX00_001896 [Menopon gallinae]|uniref:Zinc finger CCCH domain-containing protein 14 n=1 Tax=Menopon gallinae TaxID=328185 RepID=A0AAW2IFI6_9NEOP
MVMVANKRSRRQMDIDLQLFLGSNTKTFTSWLHTVLQKLQEVTVANFDMKKELAGGKSGKSPNSDDERKESKSSDEKSKSGKKHTKKHKDGKKLKKSKHKMKDKEKSKSVEKKQRSESLGSSKEKKLETGEDALVSCHTANNSSQENNKKDIEGNSLKLDNSSGTGAFGSTENIDRFKHFRGDQDDSSSKSSSASHFTDEPISTKIGENYREVSENKSHEQNKYTDVVEVIEDEFNIEPLQPNEIWDHENSEDLGDKIMESKNNESQAASKMTIKAPTRELLKEHDKIHSEAEETISKERKRSVQDSEESLSPEEIRKQLLLSRAKKKLEQSKIPGRMKSNSPDIEVVENSSGGRNEEKFSSHRTPSSTKRQSQRREYSEGRERPDGDKSTSQREGRANSPISFKHKSDDSHSGSRNDQRKNVISISKSLEMEKNLGVKNEESKKSKTKTNSSPRRKPVPSRVVTIPEPEAPEIPSIVKVKPREYVPKDKQANKVLILKAVADAEKSIATVHNRNDGDVEVKKTEALFTKNLRGKRYEKLAVTLSNVQGGVTDRDRAKRMVSVDSENTNALDRRTESLKDSELSQGFRSVPELTLKNISSKSEDQFISSKTSAMEKNDKYIHCWLEGVEKAVKDDEIVNPSEIDDFHRHFSDEGKEGDDASLVDEERKRKKMKSDDDRPSGEETSKSRKTVEKASTNAKTNSEEGPQIVVTLDGLTSKAIKDIILRNRDAPNGPLLATGRKTDKNNDEEEDDEEESAKFRHKGLDSAKNAGTSRHSDSESRERGFEKISERFGRINKTNEIHEYKEKYYEFERERYEKKYLKYQGTEKEKHYEKLKDKYASAGESKNKKLIAKLSEKFGKVDREFENKKRKYSDDDARYSYSSRRVDRPADRDGKYRKIERNTVRSGFSQ